MLNVENILWFNVFEFLCATEDLWVVALRFESVLVVTRSIPPHGHTYFSKEEHFFPFRWHLRSGGGHEGHREELECG